MNTKPNVPEEISWGKDYSWRADQMANSWLALATLISVFSDIFFASAVKQWPLGWRVAVVLAEFLAIALWARSLTRWIRGMDELHRRIMVSTVLFAISATFFFVMLWHGLYRAGLFDVIFFPSKPGASWDICTLTHEFLLLVFFYAVGHLIFNRRFK